ncbi:MAG: LysR family transcriptional regulator [Terriglobales bacterium]
MATTPGDATGSAVPDRDLIGILDPRRVLIFRQIARSGSLSAAARTLGWTQPAIGQHMRRLERDAGQPLIIRTSSGVSLTEAGRGLLRHADALASRLTLAETELAALADLRAGRLRIAAFPSAAAILAPALMTDLNRDHPGVDVRLIEPEPPEAERLLRGGDCDLALVFDYAPRKASDTDLSIFEICRDPMRAVLPLTHPLAAAGDISLSQLSSERWTAGCPKCREQLLHAADRAGFVPDIRHNTDDYVVAQNLVAAGLTVALLPQLALEAHRNPAVSLVKVRDVNERSVRALTVAGAEDVPAISSALRVLKARFG